MDSPSFISHHIVFSSLCICCPNRFYFMSYIGICRSEAEVQSSIPSCLQPPQKFRWAEKKDILFQGVMYTFLWRFIARSAHTNITPFLSSRLPFFLSSCTFFFFHRLECESCVIHILPHTVSTSVRRLFLFSYCRILVVLYALCRSITVTAPKIEESAEKCRRVYHHHNLCRWKTKR